MSFCVWNEKPPFEFDEGDVEKIYKVGDKFIVTDDPSRATQEEIDAVLHAPAEPSVDEVFKAVVSERLNITDADLAQARQTLAANKGMP